MDQMWAPWRTSYVKKVIAKKTSKVSIFSEIIKQKKDKKNYIFLRYKSSFAVLNLYPYNNGHSLVIPNRQVEEIEDLDKEERNDLLDCLAETKILLKKVLKPQGFNIGINVGRVAGAGIPEHLHVHIVPRWVGDMNFMPIVNGTKVISQSLESVYDEIIKVRKKGISI